MSCNTAKNSSVKGITWKQLFDSPHTLQFPFSLTVKNETKPIMCEEIIRILPGKRLVFFGTWAGKEVAIKLFLQPGKAVSHYQRETDHLKQLTESNVSTTKICFSGTTVKYNIPILITEKIQDAYDLETLWRTYSESETINQLMHAVILELATQHVIGIMQKDLHLGNLLVKNNKIYTLDASQIDFFYKPLSLKLSLQHLALFFAQLGAGTKMLRQKLFQLYCESRGWQIKRAYILRLEKLTHKYLKQRLFNYRKKVLRNNSEIKIINQLTQKIYFNRAFESTEMLKLFNHPEIAFQNNPNILKNGRSSTVVEWSIDGKQYVIKRYNMKHFFHWLRRCLRPTRGQKSWAYAHVLQLAGIATARPIACIEKRFLGVYGWSYFIMEYITGENLATYFTNPAHNTSEINTLVKNIVHLLKQLKEIQITHGDLKATNFIIDHNNNPVLIDLDGITQHKTRQETNYFSSKEIQRFQKNWENLPEVQALFEKAFLQK